MLVVMFRCVANVHDRKQRARSPSDRGLAPKGPAAQVANSLRFNCCGLFLSLKGDSVQLGYIVNIVLFTFVGLIT